jgi:hypothetical protein
MSNQSLFQKAGCFEEARELYEDLLMSQARQTARHTQSDWISAANIKSATRELIRLRTSQLPTRCIGKRSLR